MAELHQDYESFWRATPALIWRLLRALHPQPRQPEPPNQRSLYEYLQKGGA